MNWTEYTTDEISEKMTQIRSDLKEKGWDDAILYIYEISSSSLEDALMGILNQTSMFNYGQEDVTYETSEPVVEHGPATTFGGIVKADFPSLQTLLGGEDFDSDRLEEVRTEVLTTCVYEGPEKGDTLAGTYLDGEFNHLPEVKRIFFRALIPVKFADNDYN